MLWENKVMQLNWAGAVTKANTINKLKTEPVQLLKIAVVFTSSPNTLRTYIMLDQGMFKAKLRHPSSLCVFQKKKHLRLSALRLSEGVIDKKYKTWRM